MQGFLVFRYERIINAPLQLVVDCVHEDEHIMQWNSFVVESIYDNENEIIGLGTKYISRQQLGENRIEDVQCEVVEFDKNRLIAVSATTREGVSTTRYSFNEVKEGTEIIVEVYIKPSNWYYKLLSILTKKLTKFVYVDEFKKCEEYIYEQLEWYES